MKKKKCLIVYPQKKSKIVDGRPLASIMVSHKRAKALKKERRRQAATNIFRLLIFYLRLVLCIFLHQSYLYYSCCIFYIVV